MNRPNLSYQNIRAAIGLLILIELFACGSGQILTLFGGITLRMVNFTVMLIIGFLYLLKGRPVMKDIILLFIIFCLLLIVNGIIGFSTGKRETVFIDLKSYSYFLTILFFYYYIKNLDIILFAIKVLKYTALTISIVYLLYLLLLYSKIINFGEVYSRLHEFTDFKYRGTTGLLFYKGFVLLPIGLLFYCFDKGFFSLQAICIIIAIYFTQTRSFWVIASAACFFYFLFNLNEKRFKVSSNKLLMTILILTFSIIFILSFFSRLDGDRIGGDYERIQTVKQVFERTNISSFFIGHGLGVGVPIREIHMEMSFLEIFHKQGLLGLLFWAYIMFESLRIMLSTKENNKIVVALFLTILLIYIQSLFNPYLTNSIGTGLIIISFVSLKRLKEDQVEINPTLND